MKILSPVISLCLLFFLSFLLVVPAHADGINCTTSTIPVHLDALSLTTYNIVGTLCNPDGATVVQLLVSGATYGSAYWDFPYQTSHYSYVNSMNQHGYATFNFDRIGIGRSDHPLSALITVESNAFVAHQLIAKLRNGSLGGQAFSKVVIVGHSLGSAISVSEATTYHDVDGVILTGYLHNLNPAFTPNFADFYPAFLDPKFAHANLDPGYLTTMPGTRGIFYATAFADPNVIAKDEETKETVTTEEFAGLNQVFLPVTLQISAPVLNVIGRLDALVCGGTVDCSTDAGVLAHELPFYSPAAHYQLSITDDSGHDLNLHLNAQSSYAAIRNWLGNNF